MKRITRAALALVLASGLCVQLSAQAAEAGPIHQQPQVRAAQSGNPPAAVRQPGSKTRLITAIVFVAGLVAVGVIFQHRN